MNYPTLPWLLQGFGFQTLQLTSISEAKQHVPTIFEIVPVWPGKTASGIYIAKYELGSTLTYSEFMIIRALVRYRSKIGFWCSRIYVDHPLSLQGGKSIWQLPKQLAIFHWQDNKQVKIIIDDDSSDDSSDGSSIDIDFYYRSKIASKTGIPLNFSVPLLTESKDQVYFSKMKIAAKLKLGRTNITLLKKTENHLFSCYYEQLYVIAKAPFQQMEK